METEKREAERNTAQDESTLQLNEDEKRAVGRTSTRLALWEQKKMEDSGSMAAAAASSSKEVARGSSAQKLSPRV
jgi:hypothetical protein